MPDPDPIVLPLPVDPLPPEPPDPPREPISTRIPLTQLTENLEGPPPEGPSVLLPSGVPSPLVPDYDT